MSQELPKQYDPQAAQQKWYTYWEQNGYFNADPQEDKPSHTIMIPLPNVTGALHMGHALNGTLQDLITRRKRMQGFEALWMPGTDHAGIATQAVVERRMFEEEGLTRRDIGRDALVNRIWKWKETYEGRILSQLKSIGASCDWRRTRFTLDDVCEKAVRRTFFKLFKDGLIYRGKRLVNWDAHLQTAVADDEVFSEDVNGHFWTYHYFVVDENGNETDTKISFSTTRPETMLGDTAVCVYPGDERYTDLVGKKVRIPLNGRDIPIIEDAFLADKEKGTGAVKVTPAHDPNDYACYLRHVGKEDEIDIINLLNPDGTFNENAGEYEGLDRYAVRNKIVEDLEKRGCLESVEDRVVPLKHSDRSKTPVEPYLSDQWFVAMDDPKQPLSQNAMDAIEDGRVKFYPGRYAKTYLDWLGEKRDWCISRQLWWGHRIPVWVKIIQREYNKSERETKHEDSHSDPDVTAHLKDEFKGKLHFQSTRDDRNGITIRLACVDEGCDELETILESAGYVQDPDVLDTWFSSALWPQETLGWPDTDHNPPLNGEPDNSGDGKNTVLPSFYPGDKSVLVTSRDIITLWVARMVLTGLYNMGDVPFHHVHVHPKILDGFGQTMSKSKGNGVDPVDLIEKYGTDAVRFTITSFAGETQDVRLPINYECPHCETLIDPKLYKLDTITIVVPSSMKGAFPIPQGAAKPTMVCTKCKKESQFPTPMYTPDPDVSMATMDSERFEYGRNFCNKFWNAARFAMMNLEDYTPGAIDEADLRLEDRWILSRLSSMVHEVNEYLERYQFDGATRSLRDFIWNEFCDWYLEMIKPRLRDEEQKPQVQRVLVGVLDTLLRMLAPFTPFIAEELWDRLKELAPSRGLFDPVETTESVTLAQWPDADNVPRQWQDRALEMRFGRLQETVVAIRNVRAVYNIPPSTPMKLYMKCNEEVASDLTDVSAQFENLSRIILEAAGADIERPPGSASFTMDDADGYIPLEGLIDKDAELARQQKEKEKLGKLIKSTEGKLGNENFVSKAPEEVVAQVRDTLAGFKKQLESVEEIISQLSE
ncbi:MAG: valine--tRNA ligase [Planctomycetaceae bacterium]|jgi:valyl-tRNA synthetase|nr:valine--tRNA ligase [Planctomycetaceae bacterium]